MKTITMKLIKIIELCWFIYLFLQNDIYLIEIEQQIMME